MPFFSRRHQHKPLSEQVIVITGASSGIGLATAQKAAAKGARVVLASRNESALAEAQRRIEDNGGDATYVVADVGNKDDVQKIVNAAVETYGGFDTWVNNAGVSIIGRMEEISDDDNKRLFDTNFWGLVYGSLAAAEHLKSKGGTIINLGSLLSDMSTPLQGMYSASKHAIKGFTDALRIEIEADNSPVCVTLVKPAAIATPFFSHAKNYMENEPKAPPPVYAPEEVAYAILHAAQNPVRDIRVGGSGVVMAAMNAHAPSMMDWLNEKLMMRAQLSDVPKSRRKNNLHDSGKDGEVRGKDMPKAMPSLYTRAALHPILTGLAVTAAGAAAYALLGKKGGKFGKTALTGLNLVMPMQNAVIAKSLLKMFEKRRELDTSALRSNVKAIQKAVNENADIVRQRTKKFLK